MTMPTPMPANPLERVATYAVRDAILSAEELAELLAFAVAHEPHFEASGVGSTVTGTARLEATIRASLMLPHKHFMPWRDRITAIVKPLLPGILDELGLKPFDIERYEIELARHNDGEFYLRHIDTGTGVKTEIGGRRAVSLVYYFHAEPKAFDGGALRLYALTREDIFVDVLPKQNRLVAFASWVPHAVMPISCRSGRFIDSRFAINCWVRMKPATPVAA